LKDHRKQLQEKRDNALEWVKENLLKDSYEKVEHKEDLFDLDLRAQDICNAIQVFLNREVLKEGEEKLCHDLTAIKIQEETKP